MLVIGFVLLDRVFDLVLIEIDFFLLLNIILIFRLILYNCCWLEIYVMMDIMKGLEVLR